MAQLLNEIEWAEPVLPAVENAEWEAVVKRAVGHVSDVHRRVSPSPWLRRACLRTDSYRVSHMPVQLVDRGALVTAQESSCRYCYGAVRAFMRILGYSERMIGRIEREAQMGELDPKERAFLQFCRNLARSNPRPARAEREALIALGYAPLAVTEMAFFIAMNCFFNRVTTLAACPPEAGLEKFSGSLAGRLLALAGPVLLRPLMNRKRRVTGHNGNGGAPAEGGAFRSVIEALEGLPAQSMFAETIDGALASPVLPRRTKMLMFAVVARALECAFCQTEARTALIPGEFEEAEYDGILSALGSPALEPFESSILAWVRDTVHYQPRTIQEQTRKLGVEIGGAALLEAVGVAALANGTVRLAMLLE